MTREEYIESILSHIDDKYAKIEVKNELEAHLDDRIAFYTDAGYDYDYALEKAIERMGDSKTIGLQMNRLHSNKKLQVFIWILAGLFSVIAIVCRYNMYFEIFESSSSEIFKLPSLFFHTGVIIFTTAFLFASKHKKYKVLFFISIVNLLTFGRLFTYLSLGVTDLYNSPLAASSLLFTYTSDKISSVLSIVFVTFGVYDIAYMLFAGVFGILISAQIKAHLYGTAKTNILKRYQKLNALTVIAFLTEILSIVIFLLSFGFLMRS